MDLVPLSKSLMKINNNLMLLLDRFLLIVDFSSVEQFLLCCALNLLECRNPVKFTY